MTFDLSFEVKVPDIPLAKDGGAKKIVGEEMLAATEFALSRGRSAILPHTPVNFGFLRKGVQTSVMPNQDGVFGRIFNPLAHALPMETGTKAFWPPLAPLILWVQRKLHVEAKDARGVAFLVARKISKKGIAARSMFTTGWNEVKGSVDLRFDTALIRIKTRLAGRL